MAPCLCLVHKENAIVQVESYWLFLRRPTLILGFVVDKASLGLIFSSSTLNSPCELNNRHTTMLMLIYYQLLAQWTHGSI
jgi:hypothetical protein